MAKKSGGKPFRKTIRKAPVSRVVSQTGSLPGTADHSRPAEKSFPIVGVGASAGGLEAFTQLLEHLPATTGMAFVLIQHLDPTHPSQLPEILARKSAMPVREVHGDTVVEPDHVYITPASNNLRIEDGILRGVSRPDRAGARNMAIDDFLESLAKERGNLAFGIVLSGTASDGTIGLKAIKTEGGITFAQEPSSAKFDGMPSSAIAAGAVDFVLRPESIAKQLVSLAGHSYVNHRLGAELQEEISAPPGGDLNLIFAVLRTATGVDFTYYKRNTILRRIERRMALHGMESLKEYSRRLRHDAAEAKILAQDFLINVTAFFREPETYKILKDTVFPALIEHRSPNDPIRVWIPGCSTGEEAYSIAIVLTEFLDEHGLSCGIQIFATDLSDSVIDRARSGVYLENAVSGVSPERLRRFFISRDRVYQINESIRRACVFAKQDLTKDPPFSKIDLISCCNLLIYLGPLLQKRAISLFHYALKPGGFLVLGSSESIGSYADAFQTVDRKLRIYSKKSSSGPLTLDLSGARASPAVHTEESASTEGAGAVKNVQKYVDRMLLAEYSPPGVIVDDALHVIQVRGDTGSYIQLPPGDPTTDLTRLVKAGLLAPLKAAIRKARHEKTPVVESGLHVRDKGNTRDVDLRVLPIRDPNGREQCWLILFEEKPRGKATRGKGKPAIVPKSNRDHDTILHLEQELRATRDYLQSIVESQEAATEELRSANEEAQATNEELDTAKEELQASNEELNTVNDELRARNLEQGTLNSDLRKLLESINVPLVMVGKNLHIRWFTPAMEPLLNLLPTDQGRPITDLHSEVIPNIRDLLLAGIAGEQTKNIEMQGTSGRWLSLRILPYRGPDNTIDGAIATLVDIDDLRRARDFAEAVAATVREPLIVLDAGLRVRTANEAFYRMFNLEKKDVEGRQIYDVGGTQWNIPGLRELLENILPKHTVMKDYELEQTYPGIGLRTMLLHAREIRQRDGERMILLAIDDVTALRQSAEELRKTNEDLKQFVFAASHDLQEPIRMILTYSDLLAQRYGAKLESEGAKFINYMIEGAQRLEALIAGLREFWQLSERVAETPTLVDCNQVLKAVLLNLETMIADSGAMITADRLPSVMASETPLMQLFQNLIGNAIKYRSPAPPNIHVSSAESSAEWMFSFADNGEGVDPEYSTEIFRVFKRLHPRAKYPGTGIGLSICQKIVERYRGRIWVEPNPGGGSIFKFTIAK
jgi:two-component system, chemotaxis family, CheB/CheR fusion protein